MFLNLKLNGGGDVSIKYESIDAFYEQRYTGYQGSITTYSTIVKVNGLSFDVALSKSEFEKELLKFDRDYKIENILEK